MVADASDEWQLTWHHLQQGLGNKWALHVLHVIAARPCSFSDLKQSIDGISEAMISRRLADLQEKGFVETRTVAATPPRKEYVLTPAGERIGAFLTEMDAILSVGGDGEETYLISTL
jgi:DNA-binding HxlR family transcriptional regulator